MTTPAWKFPLLVLAISPREIGFVASTGPMRIDVVRSWSVRHVAAKVRRQFLERRLRGALAEFNPSALIVTNGTRWRIGNKIRSRYKATARGLGIALSFVGVEHACSIMRCPRRLTSAAERVVAWHPELERRLRPALATKVDPDALRDVRPMLSALTVAHAASVRHVIKFG